VPGRRPPGPADDARSDTHSWIRSVKSVFLSVLESRVTGVQNCVEPRARSEGASVDPTEARCEVPSGPKTVTNHLSCSRTFSAVKTTVTLGPITAPISVIQTVNTFPSSPVMNWSLVGCSVRACDDLGRPSSKADNGSVAILRRPALGPTCPRWSWGPPSWWFSGSRSRNGGLRRRSALRSSPPLSGRSPIRSPYTLARA